MTYTITPNDQKNLSIFPGGSSTLGDVGTSTFYTWTKPDDAFFVWIMVMSSGGAGGNGATGSTTTIRAGGIGGGQSPVFTGLYPSYMVPDVLYIKVANENYANSTSTVAQYYSGAYIDSNCTFAFAHTIGGSSTTLVTVGNLGLAPVANTANTGYQHSGVYSNTVPIVPVIPATGLSTSVNTAINSVGAPGGTAGVNSDSAGFDLPPANISNTYFVPTILSGQSNTVPDGGSGVFSLKPFYSTGGAGGYAQSATGTGGARSGIGGKGAFGSGGGGGGAGINTRANPRGGSGGPGLIIIKTF